MPSFDPTSTALILIDLQRGIARPGLAPREAEVVIATAKDLAARFRDEGAPVVLVHVGWREDGKDRPSAAVDRPMLPPELPEDFSRLVDGLEQPGDIVVLKHHWGAFTGTSLDLELRRRGVTTVVVAGIATNFGVESTVRSAWELSYGVVVVEDACTSRSAELHAFAVENILPAIARVVQAQDVQFG